jgi:hypothetical protein
LRAAMADELKVLLQELEASSAGRAE